MYDLMCGMNIITDSAPPPKREKSIRLTEELRSMKSGQSVIVDPEVALALASYMRYHGKETRRKKVQGFKIQVWVI